MNVRKQFKRISLYLAVPLLAVAAALFVVSHLAAKITVTRVQIESILGRALHAQVHIKKVGFSFADLHGQLSLDGVVIQHAGSTLSVRHARVTFGWWNSLKHGRWWPAALLLHNVAVQGQIIRVGDTHKVLPWHVWLRDIPDFDVKIVDANVAGLNIDSLAYRPMFAGVAQLQVAASYHKQPIKALLQYYQTWSAVPAMHVHINTSVAALLVWQPLLNKLHVVPQLKLQSGSGAVEFEGSWRGDSWQRLQLSGKTQDVHFSWWSAPNRYADVILQRQLELAKLSGTWQWRRLPSGWVTTARNMRVQWRGHALAEHRAYWRHMNTGSVENKLYLDQFDLRYVPFFAAFIPSNANSAKFLSVLVGASGHLSKLHVSFSRANGLQHFATTFDQLALQPGTSGLGVRGLSGHVDGTPASGYLVLDSRGGAILQRTAVTLPFANLRAQLAYSKHAGAWDVALSSLHYADAYANVNAAGVVTQLAGMQPHIDLDGDFAFNDLSHFKQYVPYSVVSLHLGHWLHQAFVAGKIADGKLHVHGKLREFPFKHGGGSSDISMHCQDVGFIFDKHWPGIQQLNAALDFHNGGLQINVAHAQMLRNPVTSVVASIADLAHPVLSVDGHVVSHFMAGQNFLTHSPLEIGKRLSPIVLRGPYKLDLQLLIPLHSKKPAHAQGVINLGNDKIVIPAWKMSFVHVGGVLRFNDAKMDSQDLHGLWLGRVVQAQVSTRSIAANNSDYTIDFRSKSAPIKPLLAHFYAALLPWLHGQVALRGLLTIPHDEHQSSALAVSSDLQGVRVAPQVPLLSKTATQSRDASIRWVFGSRNTTQVQIAYGALLRGRFRWQKNARSGVLVGGRLAFSQLFPKTKCNGLCITGVLPTLDTAKLMYFARSMLKSTNKLDISKLNLNAHVNLLVKKLITAQGNFSQIGVRVQQQDKAWQLVLHGPALAGTVAIPLDHSQPWSVRIAHVSLPDFKWAKHSSAVLQPQQLPPLALQAKDVHLGSLFIKKMRWISKPVARGLKISTWHLVAPNYSLSLSGHWYNRPQADTLLRGSLLIKDAGQVLRSNKLMSLISGGRGQVNFALEWADALPHLRRQDLYGDLKFNLLSGRILLPKSSVHHLVLVRLLNVLSISALPEKLLHAFTGMTQNGVAFSDLRGEIILNNNVAVLDNVDMHGSAINMQMNGTVDTQKHLYNLDVVVNPQVISSLPLIAGLAAGPIAGITTWIVSELVGPHIGRALGSAYHIGGSWNHPIVNKVNT